MDLNSESVYLQKCISYDDRELSDCLDTILSPCLQERNLRSCEVLLKPNLLTARMGPLACTEGKFILASVKWFLDNGARVSIGDSPAFGTATGVLKRIGIAQQLEKLPVTITDFTHLRKMSLPSGIEAGLAADVLDADLLVNIPRVKAHAQLRVTLGVKNLFGCLVGMRKPIWHMAYGGCGGGFADHLVDLMSILPDGVTLVDGITAMHRTGPIAGESFPLGIVAGSNNPVAVDRSILEILDITPEASPLMVSCIAKAIAGTDIAGLDFPLLRPEEMAVKSFIVPQALHPIRFNPVRFIRGSLKRAYLRIHPSS